jgi:hypothetical protein
MVSTVRQLERTWNIETLTCLKVGQRKALDLNGQFEPQLEFYHKPHAKIRLRAVRWRVSAIFPDETTLV